MTQRKGPLTKEDKRPVNQESPGEVKRDDLVHDLVQKRPFQFKYCDKHGEYWGSKCPQCP